MNNVVLMGRLTKDPDTGKSTRGTEYARYTLAVDRRGDGADFISCVAFGKAAEFAQKYLKKGVKIAVTGEINTGKYTDMDGRTVYTTDVIVRNHEFAESKKAQDETPPPAEDEFMPIPEDVDEELPFA